MVPETDHRIAHDLEQKPQALEVLTHNIDTRTPEGRLFLGPFTQSGFRGSEGFGFGGSEVQSLLHLHKRRHQVFLRACHHIPLTRHPPDDGLVDAGYSRFRPLLAMPSILLTTRPMAGFYCPHNASCRPGCQTGVRDWSPLVIWRRERFRSFKGFGIEWTSYARQSPVLKPHPLREA